MIKLFIGALLVATTTLAQTTPQTAKGGAAKPTSGSVTATAKMTKPTAGSATKPMAKADTRPVPQTTENQNLQSGDNAIPSYRMEKDKGVRKGRNRYPAKDAKKQ